MGRWLQSVVMVSFYESLFYWLNKPLGQLTNKDFSVIAVEVAVTLFVFVFSVVITIAAAEHQKSLADFMLKLMTIVVTWYVVGMSIYFCYPASVYLAITAIFIGVIIFMVTLMFRAFLRSSP